jgi:hypothetical protein
MTSYDGPMRDEEVEARNDSGAGATATTGPSGVAVLPVPPGTYVVQAKDPCGRPSTVTPMPHAPTTVDLVCVAP